MVMVTFLTVAFYSDIWCVTVA